MWPAPRDVAGAKVGITTTHIGCVSFALSLPDLSTATGSED